MLNLILSLILGIASSPLKMFTDERKNKGLFLAFFSSITFYVLFTLTDYLLLIQQDITMKVYVVLVFGIVAFAINVTTSDLHEDVISSIVPMIIIAISALCIISYIVISMNSTKDKYNAVEVEVKEELPAFDEKAKPISVPLEYAENKMRKSFGQVPNSSYYQLGEPRIQELNGDIVYVAPVEFSSIFKWWKENTTPGYFVLSATDTSANPKFVKQEMKYISSAYFGKNAERNIYYDDPSLLFKGRAMFEVSDDGIPYTFQTYGKFVKKIGRVGFVPQGIVMVNAIDGEVSNYKLKDIPKWIDAAVSSETANYMNIQYGKFKHGVLNKLFAQKEVIIPSENGNQNGVTPVFFEEKMYYFSDFSSPKTGIDSMMGYSLIDANTGKLTFYSGNEESSLMDSDGAIEVINKKFLEKEWEAEVPILYNFYGEPSWFVSVTDNNGFLQQISIVSAENHDIYVSSTSTKDALKKYKNLVNSKGASTVSADSVEETKKGDLIVDRVYKERVDDFTQVFILSKDGDMYTTSTELSNKVLFLESGDFMDVEYIETGSEFWQITEIKNH